MAKNVNIMSNMLILDSFLHTLETNNGSIKGVGNKYGQVKKLRSTSFAVH